MVQIMKQAAVEAVETGKPVQLVFGKVLSASPVEIRIDQKLTVKEPFVVLTRNVTDYHLDMSMSHATEPGGEHSHSHGVTTSGGSGTSDVYTAPQHVHQYGGRKTFTVHNALKAGETVLMARMQGGQRYLVLDRMV